MDPATTAATLVTLLSPHLPALWQLGDKFAEGMVKKLGEKAPRGMHAARINTGERTRPACRFGRPRPNRRSPL